MELKLQNDGTSKVWEVEKNYESFYTGGKIQYALDPSILVCENEGSVTFFDTKNGQITRKLKPEGDAEKIICFELNPVKNEIITASQNFLIRHWDLTTGECVRQWKAHDGPILSMCFESTGKLLATGSSDHTAKVWNIEGGFCTHNFRDHEGVINFLIFNPFQLHLITCCDDTKIRIWDLTINTCIKILTEHLSVCSSISFSDNNKWMCTAGRDKVVNIYNSQNYSLLKTVLIYEELEGIKCLKNSTINELYFITCGAEGKLKKWKFFEKLNNQYSYKCESAEKENSSNINQPFIHLLYNKDEDSLIGITKECNFLYYNSETLEVTNQIAGFNDEIIDMKYIDDNRIAVASNSELIRIFNIDSFSCKFLKGHTDTVLCLDLDIDHKYIVSGSKDNTIRIWSIETYKCIGICKGHTSSVSGVCLPHAGPVNQFIISGGNDKVIKKWLFPKKWNNNNNNDDEILEYKCEKSIRGHDKEINTIIISPNNMYIASGSQESTIKLWFVKDLKLYLTLKGHKRGIWSLEFSTIHQTLLSSSGDKTIKLWNIKDGNCLKTFEGHNSAVLKSCFICNGLQIISSSGDGLIKLWNIKDNECINTFDKHKNKIWSLNVNNNHFISGGSDSIINIWKDVSLELEEKKIKENEEYILEEQELRNCIRKKEFKKAFHLSLTLNRPHDCLVLLQKIFEENIDISEYIIECNDEELKNLIDYLVKWNTHAKNTVICSRIMKIIFVNNEMSKLAKLINSNVVFDSLLSYFERHLNRIDRLIESSFLLDYCLFEMGSLNAVLGDGENNNDGVDVKKKKRKNKEVEIDYSKSTKRIKH